MKKTELMNEILNNKEKVPPKDDPRLSSIIADLQHLLNTGAQIAGDDKKIIDCRAELNQRFPFKYEGVWGKHLTGCSSDTARISDMLTQDSPNEVDVQLKKMVETFDTYIPEPLRNADGTPIYVHANGSRSVRATDGASSAGMFAQKSAKQQDLSSMDPLIYGDSSLSSYDAGSKK